MLPRVHYLPLLVLQILAFGLPAFGQTESSPDTLTKDKLHKLDFHLEKIRRSYENGRFLGGGTLLVVGTAIGVGGGAAIALSGDSIKDTASRNTVLGVTIGTGLLLDGLGLVSLLLKTDFENLPEKYQKMSQDEADSARAKLIFGETTLRSLADSARVGRLASAGVLGLSGVAMVAISFSDKEATRSSGLYGGLTYLGLGVLNCFLESIPELESRAYRERAE